MSFYIRDIHGRLTKVNPVLSYSYPLDTLISQSSSIQVEIDSMANQEHNYDDEDIRSVHSEAEAREPHQRTLRDYLNSARHSLNSCIALPYNQNIVNIKPHVMYLMPTFHGMDSENPYHRIRDFIEVCYTFHDN